MKKELPITLKKIYNKNKFLNLLQNDISSSLSKIKKFPKGMEALSMNEKFLIYTHFYTMQILSKLKELEYFIPFINSFPKTKMWQKVFNRVEYLRYHLSFYFINVVSVFDRFLSLINFLWDLGTPDKKVSYQLIIQNNHLEHTKTKGILKDFYKFLDKSNIKEIRNLIAHRGEFSDPELDKAATYLFIISHNSLNKKEKYLWKFVADMKIKERIRFYKKESTEINNKVMKLADDLLNSLVDQYQTRKKFLIKK
jgi:hypothetical protein